jgi:hypothetical protein
VNALTYIPVERPPAPVAMRFPAPRTPLDAKLRKTALRVFYRMWFAEIAAFDEEARFSDHTAQLALKMEVKRCLRRAEHERLEAQKFENRRLQRWHFLGHEEQTLKAKAWTSLLDSNREMFRVWLLEIRRVREDIAAEQARVFPEMVS